MNKSDLNLCYSTDLKRLLMIYDNELEEKLRPSPDKNTFFIY
jgi:hypothetical protein